MEGSEDVRSVDEWELSKENVLPLKQGRKMTNLTAALQPQNVDRQQQLIFQRQGFETELRTYNGDDPLDPWIRYIQWTEQNFPQGGKDSHLGVLMQKCLIQFKNDDRYKQDTRHVSIWLKMAQYDSESLEIYKFMQANQIGTQLTLFYEAWAWELEQAGNTKRADAIYKEGMACNAQPRDRLERAMMEFQSRVGRAAVQQMQDGLMNPPAAAPTNEDQRSTLGDLRARGKLQKVGTSRTGAAKLSARGGLQTTGGPLQQKTNQISIFCDDGASGTAAPQPAGQWQNLPARAESQKENTRSAGQWTGQRVPQRNVPRMTFQEAGSYSKPDFTVHVDNPDDQITTPRKPVEMGFQVLSEKKHYKPTNTLHHIKQDDANDNTRAMYCKHLIYGGAREMSFEELRGIQYTAKRKEKELQAKMEEAERIRVDLLNKQREHEEMITKMQEKLEQQRIQQEQYIESIVKQKIEAMAPKLSHRSGPDQALPQPNAPLTSEVPQHLPPVVPSVVQVAPPATPAVPQQPVAEAPSAECLQRQGATSQAVTRPRTSPLDIIADQHDSNRQGQPSNSWESSVACTKQLIFDDLTGATGNFNIFCDPDQAPPAKPAPQYPAVAAPASAAKAPAAPLSPPRCNPSSTSAFSIHHQAVNASSVPKSTSAFSIHKQTASAPPLSRSSHQAEHDTITPNQSFQANVSSGNAKDDKTPQSMLSDKTPSSASFTSSMGRLRTGRLSNIRTPRGLTAPSPTINTREALGVIGAMLNCPLKNNEFDLDESEFQNPEPHQEKGFEIEIGHDENKDIKPASKESIFEDGSAFTRLGGLGGSRGIVPRRQPLSVRSDGPAGPTPLQGVPPQGAHGPPPVSFPSIPIYQDDAKPALKEAAVGKITIFEDEAVDNTKENELPSDYNQVKEKRELAGILQPSKTVPFAPMEEQDGDAVVTEAMDMQAIEVDPLASSQHRETTMNVTLPPTGSSNYSFDAAARMASTPFNDATSHKLSFMPPMSNIKPREVDQLSSTVVAPPATMPEGSRLEGVGLKREVGGMYSKVARVNNETLEETEFTVNQSGGPLSPILETSAENAQSSASSSASTANSHASASSNESQQPSIAVHVDKSKKDFVTPAPAPQGFAIHIDDEPPARNQPRAGLQERGVPLHDPQDNVAISKAAPAGFQIHIDENVAPSALGTSHVKECSRMEAANQSMKEMSLNQSRREPRPSKPEDPNFLHKDDLPDLEMSFIPDRTLQDVDQVEQDITTFGLGESSLDYSDPFNAGLQNLLLASLSKPFSTYNGIYQHDEMMPAIKPGLAVNFGDEIHVYNVMQKVGEGAFATIYLAACLDATDMNDLDMDYLKVALKVQHPPCPWEMYIIKELHARLSKLPSHVHVRPSLMMAECCHIYQDKSCLVTEYLSKGTLLDLINKQKAVNKSEMQESWVLFFTIEILQVVESMHRCKIVHGDIKPDNFLISTWDDSITCSQDVGNLLKLIDMGRSIDMTLFPEGTVFTAKCKTSGFNCVEMQSKRPWTYQVDYYGIAGTVHCMLFGKYMKVYKEAGTWKMTSKIPRSSSVNWKEFFHTLLNVPSCDPSDLPDLGDLRRQLEKYINPSMREMMYFDVDGLLSDSM